MTFEEAKVAIYSCLFYFLIIRYFLPLTSLRDLQLAKNNIVNLAFIRTSNLASSLQTLSLAKNQINNLDKGVLSVLTGLVSLDLSQNSIRFINSGVFIGMISLQTLILSHNIITDMEASVFAALANLKHLRLENNHIQEFDGNWFSDRNSLEYMSLHSNHIRKMSPSTFSIIQRLKRLELQNNNIDMISDRAFDGLRRLTYLNLGENHIANLEDGTFSYMPRLEELELDHNQITNLNSAILPDHSTIRSLDLSYNPLSYLEDNLIEKLIYLNKITISNSKLKRLPKFSPDSGISYITVTNTAISKIYECDLNSLPQMNVLYWGAAPIVCDCDTRWLIRWYREHMHTKAKQYVTRVGYWKCTSPSVLKGRYLYDLDEGNMTCSGDREPVYCPDLNPIYHTSLQTGYIPTVKDMAHVTFPTVKDVAHVTDQNVRTTIKQIKISSDHNHQDVIGTSTTSSLTHVHVDLQSVDSTVIHIKWYILPVELTDEIRFYRVSYFPLGRPDKAKPIIMEPGVSQYELGGLLLSHSYNVCVTAVGMYSDTLGEDCLQTTTHPRLLIIIITCSSVVVTVITVVLALKVAKVRWNRQNNRQMSPQSNTVSRSDRLPRAMYSPGGSTRGGSMYSPGGSTRTPVLFLPSAVDVSDIMSPHRGFDGLGAGSAPPYSKGAPVDEHNEEDMAQAEDTRL